MPAIRSPFFWPLRSLSLQLQGWQHNHSRVIIGGRPTKDIHVRGWLRPILHKQTSEYSGEWHSCSTLKAVTTKTSTGMDERKQPNYPTRLLMPPGTQEYAQVGWFTVRRSTSYSEPTHGTFRPSLPGVFLVQNRKTQHRRLPNQSKMFLAIEYPKTTSLKGQY